MFPVRVFIFCSGNNGRSKVRIKMDCFLLRIIRTTMNLSHDGGALSCQFMLLFTNSRLEAWQAHSLLIEFLASTSKTNVAVGASGHLHSGFSRSSPVPPNLGWQSIVEECGAFDFIQWTSLLCTRLLVFIEIAMGNFEQGFCGRLIAE